eukprot:Rmarinus@m.10565
MDRGYVDLDGHRVYIIDEPALCAEVVDKILRSSKVIAFSIKMLESSPTWPSKIRSLVLFQVATPSRVVYLFDIMGARNILLTQGKLNKLLTNRRLLKLVYNARTLNSVLVEQLNVKLRNTCDTRACFARFPTLKPPSLYIPPQALCGFSAINVALLRAAHDDVIGMLDVFNLSGGRQSLQSGFKNDRGSALEFDSDVLASHACDDGSDSRSDEKPLETRPPEEKNHYDVAKQFMELLQSHPHLKVGQCDRLKDIFEAWLSSRPEPHPTFSQIKFILKRFYRFIEVTDAGVGVRYLDRPVAAVKADDSGVVDLRHSIFLLLTSKYFQGIPKSILESQPLSDIMEVLRLAPDERVFLLDLKQELERRRPAGVTQTVKAFPLKRYLLAFSEYFSVHRDQASGYDYVVLTASECAESGSSTPKRVKVYFEPPCGGEERRALINVPSSYQELVVMCRSSLNLARVQEVHALDECGISRRISSVDSISDGDILLVEGDPNPTQSLQTRDALMRSKLQSASCNRLNEGPVLSTPVNPTSTFTRPHSYSPSTAPCYSPSVSHESRAATPSGPGSCPIIQSPISQAVASFRHPTGSSQGSRPATFGSPAMSMHSPSPNISRSAESGAQTAYVTSRLQPPTPSPSSSDPTMSSLHLLDRSRSSPYSQDLVPSAVSVAAGKTARRQVGCVQQPQGVSPTLGGRTGNVEPAWTVSADFPNGNFRNEAHIAAACNPVSTDAFESVQPLATPMPTWASWGQSARS